MDNLIEIRLTETCNSNMNWIKGVPLKIPKDLLGKYCSKTHDSVRFKLEDNNCQLNIESMTELEKSEIVSCLRGLRMFTEVVPFSSKIPFSYQLIPQFLRTYIAGAIGRKKRKDMHQWAKFPLFPIDLSVDALSDIFNIEYNKVEPTPVVLTHDIDSPEALKNLPMFLAEEETVGARSTNFVVPFKWKVDHGILKEMKQRGHEIGIYGFDHSNKTPFLEESAINERLNKMHDFIERYDVIGYRSPSLLRTRKLLQALSRVLKYDSSIPASGGLFPSPNNGCASARIFQVEGICEIPISMPRDAALLFLGYKPHQIKDVWFECADTISESGGIVTLLTHCEKRFIGNGMMLSVYRDLLHFLRDDKRFTFNTCKEIFNLFSHEGTKEFIFEKRTI